MSTDPSNVESDSDDNSVEFDCSFIQSISYIENSFVIDPGEPSTLPPTISQSGDTWTITVNCGRSGSSEVAQSFNNAMGGSYREYSPSAELDSTPKELNFYFGVTVKFQLPSSASADLYLGQGHRGVHNNWWLGSTCLRYDQDSPQLVISNGGAPDQVLSLSGSDSSFDIDFDGDAR